MTKSLTIALSCILLVSLGIFSAFQVKKLNTTKTNLTEQLKAVNNLNESLEIEKEETAILHEQNQILNDENLILRDSIVKLHQIIARLRSKIKKQDTRIAELENKLQYLQQQYDSKKQEIAINSRKENVDHQAIANIEAEKAEIKEQINMIEQEQFVEVSAKAVAEKEMEDKIESEERFRKIVDVVNNTRIKFQDIKIKMDPTGQPVSKLISEGKNWKHTTIEFFMNHENNKVLLDEQFVVKIIDMDFQEELSFVEKNPMAAKSANLQNGAPFYFDGNLVEIYHSNITPKRGKNFEIQVYYKSDDGEEYLLLDGVKQFIQDGNLVVGK